MPVKPLIDQSLEELEESEKRMKAIHSLETWESGWAHMFKVLKKHKQVKAKK